MDTDVTSESATELVELSPRVRLHAFTATLAGFLQMEDLPKCLELAGNKCDTPDAEQCHTATLELAIAAIHITCAIRLVEHMLIWEESSAAPSPGALGAAIRHGNVEALRLLLEDGRADPAQLTLTAVVRETCNPSLIELVVADPRVGAVAGWNAAFDLWNAVFRYFRYAVDVTDTVRVLLDSGKAVSDTSRGAPLVAAAIANCRGVLAELRDDPRVDVAAAICDLDRHIDRGSRFINTRSRQNTPEQALALLRGPGHGHQAN